MLMLFDVHRLVSLNGTSSISGGSVYCRHWVRRYWHGSFERGKMNGRGSRWHANDAAGKQVKLLQEVLAKMIDQ